LSAGNGVLACSNVVAQVTDTLPQFSRPTDAESGPGWAADARARRAELAAGDRCRMMLGLMLACTALRAPVAA
jgi:hypothetical protein